MMRTNYAKALYEDPTATLDDHREAAETLEDSERIARRVFGASHPTTGSLGGALRNARAALALALRSWQPTITRRPL